jgi:pimeloyl-ACP methyl ester carboxylesterase
MEPHAYPSHVDHLTLEANGQRFYAAAAGPPDGPLVLLLHGFPEMSFAWRRQLGPLAAAGYRAVAVDQRGYGLSSKPERTADYAADVLAQDVVGIASALDCDRFNVVGHDWGGIVAWRLATEQAGRIRRAAILNAPHPSTLLQHVLYDPGQALKSAYIGLFQLPWLPETVLRARDFELLQRALTQTSRPGVFSDEELAVYREAWSQDGALTAMLNWYRAMSLAPSLADRRVTVPVRLIWGDRDSALNASLADDALTLCDHGEVFHLPEATHWLHHEEVEQVNALLLEFLR